jgi:MFS family permease
MSRGPQSLSTIVAGAAAFQTPSSFTRWYVCIATCLIYSINIADRYVVSTVLEPIRLELHLNDAGIAFLTGVPLALFYVTLGIPISWLADRSNRRNILAASLIVWSAFLWLARSVSRVRNSRTGPRGGDPR